MKIGSYYMKNICSSKRQDKILIWCLHSGTTHMECADTCRREKLFENSTNHQQRKTINISGNSIVCVPGKKIEVKNDTRNLGVRNSGSQPAMISLQHSRTVHTVGTLSFHCYLWPVDWQTWPVPKEINTLHSSKCSLVSFRDIRDII